MRSLSLKVFRLFSARGRGRGLGAQTGGMGIPLADFLLTVVQRIPKPFEGDAVLLVTLCDARIIGNGWIVMNNNDYKDNNENLNSENTVDNKSSQNSGHRRSNVQHTGSNTANNNSRHNVREGSNNNSEHHSSNSS